jgi:predicted acetyltransferase
MIQAVVPGGTYMKVLIREWANKTATVMTTNGQVVWTFSSVSEARRACREWHCISATEPVLYEETRDSYTPPSSLVG